MKDFHSRKIIGIMLVGLFAVAHLNGAWPGENNTSSLLSLLPDLDSWQITEDPQNYFPESLFEYINGAAEAYLSYNFEELIVAEYRDKKTEASIAVEIYDMGKVKNSFGIYSAERFPDSHFLTLGIQGYLEEGVLNFLTGKYYVKLLCFECEEQSDKHLKLFSQKIVEKVEGKSDFPPILDVFPREGRIPYTEKFVLRNFMGYSFLHDGYRASYKIEDFEFECFIIEGKTGEESQSMLEQYLTGKGKDNIEEISLGFWIKDRYYQNIFLARTGKYICGVLKIKEGFEETGKKYLKMLTDSLKMKK